MTTSVSRLRACVEPALRLTVAVAATAVLSGLLVWTCTTNITAEKVFLAWLGWCAGIRVLAAAVGADRPRPVCYALALVPAAIPYLAVLGFYSAWWLLGVIS